MGNTMRTEIIVGLKSRLVTMTSFIAKRNEK